MIYDLLFILGVAVGLYTIWRFGRSLGREIQKKATAFPRWMQTGIIVAGSIFIFGLPLILAFGLVALFGGDPRDYLFSD